MYVCAKSSKDEVDLAKVVVKACESNPCAGQKVHVYSRALRQFNFKELWEENADDAELTELLDRPIKV